MIRHRTILSHESPANRHVTEEFTLLNDSEETCSLINVESATYRPALVACDSDGSTLPVIPNALIRDAAAKDGSPEGNATLSAMSRHETFVTPLVLPPNQGIPPGGYRVIRLEYADTQRPTIQALSFLSIPGFKLEGEVKGPIGPVHHFIVRPPQGFDLGVREISVYQSSDSGTVKKLTGSDHHWTTISPSVIDVAVPQTPSGTKYEIDYAILPDEEEDRLFTWLWAGTTMLALILFLLGVAANPPITAIHEHLLSIGGAILAFCVGFIGLVTNPVTHRTKLWMVVPAILAGAMIAASTLG